MEIKKVNAKSPGPTNLCKTPKSLIEAFLVAAALDCSPVSLRKSIKSCKRELASKHRNFYNQK